jgi:Subtilase family
MKWVNLKTETQYLKFQYPDIKPGAGFAGIDPHLLWADLSYFAGADIFSQAPIPVLFEVERSKLDAILDEPSPIVNLTGGSENLFGNFYTGFVTPTNLAFLISRVDRLRIASVDLPSTLRQKKSANSVDRSDLSSHGDEIVIGVIDHGIGFANKHFASQNANGRWESRIERVWDQQRGYPAPPPRYDQTITKRRRWDSTNHYGYGREIVNTGTKRQIDYWLNQDVSERETYGVLKYLPAQGAVGHGTHVMGLAAGNRLFSTDTHGAAVQTITDDASRAKIIAVQLPAVPYKDTSGAGLCVQILDAISYIHMHAAGRKVVINLSDGAYAGPHDGTSMLERALDAFYASNKHQSAFVVAAGNQFHEKVHWQATVTAMQGSTPGTTEINWSVLPDDKTDSHLEIWPDSSLKEEDLRALSVFVTPPGQGKLGPVNFGEAFSLFEDGSKLDEPAICMTAFLSNPPNSYNAANPELPRAMIHIALSATRPTAKSKRKHQRKAAPHGIWTVELLNSGKKPATFNAYIERDNPALGDSGPTRQSHFVHPGYPRNAEKVEFVDDTANTSPIKRMGALNNVATATTVLVVGGSCLNTDALGGKHPELARYSAAGPGRGAGAREGVDLLAPGDMSRSIRGIRGLGTRTGTSFRMDGTSVAAPQVTREIANLMAAGNLADSAKQSLLSRAANGVSGPVERIGAGVI